MTWFKSTGKLMLCFHSAIAMLLRKVYYCCLWDYFHRARARVKATSVLLNLERVLYPFFSDTNLLLSLCGNEPLLLCSIYLILPWVPIFQCKLPNCITCTTIYGENLKHKPVDQDGPEYNSKKYSFDSFSYSQNKRKYLRSHNHSKTLKIQRYKFKFSSSKKYIRSTFAS